MFLSCYSECGGICRLLMFVSDASGDHMVETYSSMGLVMAVVCFEDHFLLFLPCCWCECFICIVLRNFVVVISMCLLYVSLNQS